MVLSSQTSLPAKAARRPLHVGLIERDELVRAGAHAMIGGYSEAVTLLDPPPAAGPLELLLVDPEQLSEPVNETVAMLRERTGARRVVALSWRSDARSIRRAVALGVDGYLSKALSSGELMGSLLRIGAGERLLALGRLDPEALASARQAWSGGAWAEGGLTARQVELLELVAAGLSNDQICVRLFLSKNTVKSYIRALYRRIGVKNRSQAVRWGFEHGFGARRADSALLAG